MKEWLAAHEKEWVEAVWQKLTKKLEAECRRVGDKMPYFSKDGCYTDRFLENKYWWTNGFWPGMLWQMYSETKNEIYLNTARRIEERLDESLEGYVGLHHDVGFMWLLSAVADYRLIGNEKSKIRGLHAASLLAGRYNPRGKYLRAWNLNYTGRIIVDCMMNLPLLYWASDELDDPRFKFIAMDHADTCLKYIMREDGSCNHMVDLDPEDGSFIDNPRGQGYESGSSWTRGQAWALYGYVLSYLHTKEETYLNVSKKTANYFIANVRQTGYIPPVDFRMPAEPAKYDTTAGTIAACGLLELSKLVGAYDYKVYFDAALAILHAIEEKHSDWNEKNDGIVQFGSAEYHNKPEEAHVPIIYGDYFFIEAILKLKDSKVLFW